MTTVPTAGLEGRALACRRGGRIVFRDVAFVAAPGDLLVLRGPNGAGKSTLLRLVAGLIGPAQGDITWDGEAVADDPAAHRARTGYVGHADALKPAMTAAEHLAFHAALRDADGRAVPAALAAFGLARLAATPTRYLSQGQRRRVALARLVAAPCALWLLDEPTNGLDTESVAALEAAIVRRRETGGIVIAATHLDFAGADARTLTLGSPA